MPEQRSQLTAAEALKNFYRTHYFGDSALTDRWVPVRLGPISIPLPNPKQRRDVIELHDLHHLVTGYDTDWAGEGEVAGWELASGFPRRHWIGYLYAPLAFVTGFLVAPRRVMKAIRRGRGKENLCHLDLRVSRDQLMKMTLPELRKKIDLSPVAR